MQQKFIYAIKVLNSPMVAYFSEVEARAELEKRKEFYNEIENSLEVFILKISENDLKALIIENIELAKSLVKEETPDLYYLIELIIL